MNAHTHETPSYQPTSEPESPMDSLAELKSPELAERQPISKSTKRKLGQATLTKTELDQSQTVQNDAEPAARVETADDEEQTYAEQVLADIARWRDHYDSDERDFIKYTTTVHPKTPEEIKRYEARILRAEHDAAFNWYQMQTSTREAVSEHIIPSNQYAIAYAERYGEGINPGDTIEAASAQFYDERIQDLKAALENNPNLSDEERQAKTRLLRETWSVVYAYIESTDDIYHDHSGQLRRNQCHNDMIKHLNQINDLARENSVTPLTFRNFMPNDVTYGYQQRLDKGNTLWHKAEYDRETVAGYFRKVFAEKIAREEAARAARARYMR